MHFSNLSLPVLYIFIDCYYSNYTFKDRVFGYHLLIEFMLDFNVHLFLKSRKPDSEYQLFIYFIIVNRNYMQIYLLLEPIIFVVSRFS